MRLMFRLRQRAYGDYWDVSFPVTVEAGAEMETLAGAAERFFAGTPLP